MKNQIFKTIITMHAPQQTLRPAEAFWSECKQRAQNQRETDAVLLPKNSRWKISRFYPALASLASAAALVTLYFSLLPPPEVHRALNSFQFGETLDHNGAVVLNDKKTDATILWIMTDDAEENSI